MLSELRNAVTGVPEKDLARSIDVFTSLKNTVASAEEVDECGVSSRDAFQEQVKVLLRVEREISFRTKLARSLAWLTGAALASVIVVSIGFLKDASKFESKARDVKEKLDEEQERLLVAATAVQPIHTDFVTDDAIRYGRAMEAFAKLHSPFGNQNEVNAWRNPLWLIEWVRSANIFYFDAKYRVRELENSTVQSEPSKLTDARVHLDHWRQTGLSRIDRIEVECKRRQLNLSPEQWARLWAFKAQFSESEQEKLELYRRVWALRRELHGEPPAGLSRCQFVDSLDVIAGNNLAWALFESRSENVSVPGANSRSKGLQEAWDVAVKAFDLASEKFECDRRIPVEAVADTAWNVFQEASKLNVASKTWRDTIGRIGSEIPNVKSVLEREIKLSATDQFPVELIDARIEECRILLMQMEKGGVIEASVIPK